MSSVMDDLWRQLLHLSGPPLHDSRLAFHQRTGVARLLRKLERWPGVILADQPGLGKSFVAMAVASDFASRGYSIELLVPASLIRQWHELLVFFDLPATITSHESLPFRPRVVTPAERKLFVVDEAHRFRNPDTARYATLARISAAQRLLLVTATPICNSERDLLALLQLIVPDDALRDLSIFSIEEAFARNDTEMIVTLLSELTVIRDRSSSEGSVRIPDLRRTVVLPEPSESSVPILEAIHRLEFPIITKAGGRELLHNLLERRLESSHAALAESLRRQRRFHFHLRENLLKGLTLSRFDFQALFGDREDDQAFQDLLFPELFLPPQTAGLPDIGSIQQELERLDSCLAALTAAGDEKFCALITLLGKFTDRPALIFTGMIATARELYRQLKRGRTALVTSRVCLDRHGRRSTAGAVFESLDRGALEVVITTDLAAEGLNLQSAGAVIHYDLPWNPVRVDQRNGRIRRIGQSRNGVEAFYFLPSTRSDRGTMRVLARKNRIRRRLLGEEGGLSPIGIENLEIEKAMGIREARGEPDEHGGDPATHLVEIRSGDVRALRLILSGLDGIEERLWAVLQRTRGPAGTRPEEEFDAGSYLRRLQSRVLLPPLLGAGASQLKLHGRLGRKGSVSRNTSRLLTARYRSGIESLIGEMAGERLEPHALRDLLELLELEQKMSGVMTDADVSLEVIEA